MILVLGRLFLLLPRQFQHIYPLLYSQRAALPESPAGMTVLSPALLQNMIPAGCSMSDKLVAASKNTFSPISHVHGTRL
jgi:hypothetical protein